MRLYLDNSSLSLITQGFRTGISERKIMLLVVATPVGVTFAALVSLSDT